MAGLKEKGQDRRGGRARRSVSADKKRWGTSHPSPRPALDRTGPPDAATQRGKPRPTSSQDSTRRSHGKLLPSDCWELRDRWASTLVRLRSLWLRGSPTALIPTPL